MVTASAKLTQALSLATHSNGWTSIVGRVLAAEDVCKPRLRPHSFSCWVSNFPEVGGYLCARYMQVQGLAPHATFTLNRGEILVPQNTGQPPTLLPFHASSRNSSTLQIWGQFSRVSRQSQLARKVSNNPVSFDITRSTTV